ncbi:Hypothetical protein, putative [Bodo saltans]|uniref:Uncharacterized protein n=1 Tax=Bodo saltans TaxID=75058 RepID=A0A0S4IKE9_BODSA|nr:Hypothetical protein, putative [Bodo saltans]|eukprot:CUE66132.1 Hypothetical protein, putative [Bodo saltans]
MIRNVVSHTWRRKGFSSLLLELSPVAAPDTQVLLAILGKSEESTPYLIAASAAVSPRHGNHDDSALQDCLLEAHVLTSTSTSVMLIVQPSHKFLRLDCIGRLCSTLDCLLGASDGANYGGEGAHQTQTLSNRHGLSQAAEAAALAFDHVTHHVTVSLDAMGSVHHSARQEQHHTMERRERLALVPATPFSSRSPSHRSVSPPAVTSKPQPMPLLSDRLPSLSPKRSLHEYRAVVANDSATIGPTTAVSQRLGDLRAAHQLMKRQLQQVEEEVAWYKEEAHRWASKRVDCFAELRGSGAGRVIQTPAALDDKATAPTPQEEALQPAQS